MKNFKRISKYWTYSDTNYVTFVPEWFEGYEAEVIPSSDDIVILDGTPSMYAVETGKRMDML